MSFSQNENTRIVDLQESFLTLHKASNNPGLSSKAKDVINETLEQVQQELEKLSGLSLKHKVVGEQLAAMRDIKKGYEEETQSKKMKYSMKQIGIQALENKIAFSKEKIRSLQASITMSNARDSTLTYKNAQMREEISKTTELVQTTLERIKIRNEQINEKYEMAPQVVRMHEEEKLINDLNDRLERLATEEDELDKRIKFLENELSESKRMPFTDFVFGTSKALLKIRELKSRCQIVRKTYDKCLVEKAKKKEALRSSGRFDSFDVSMISIDHNQTLDAGDHSEVPSQETIKPLSDLTASKNDHMSRFINSQNAPTTEEAGSERSSRGSEVIRIESVSSYGENTSDGRQSVSGEDHCSEHNDTIHSQEETSLEQHNQQDSIPIEEEHMEIEQDINNETVVIPEQEDAAAERIEDESPVTKSVPDKILRDDNFEDDILKDEQAVNKQLSQDVLENDILEEPSEMIPSQEGINLLEDFSKSADIENVLNISTNSQDPAGDFLAMVQRSETDNFSFSMFGQAAETNGGDTEFAFNFGDGGENTSFNLQFAGSDDNNNDAGGDFFNFFN